jgi:hypothetical protein
MLASAALVLPSGAFDESRSEERLESDYLEGEDNGDGDGDEAETGNGSGSKAATTEDGAAEKGEIGYHANLMNNNVQKDKEGKDLHDAVNRLYESWSEINLPQRADNWNRDSKAVWKKTDHLRQKSLEMLQRLLRAHYYLSLQAQGFELEPIEAGGEKGFEPLVNEDTFYSNHYQSPVARLKRMAEFYWAKHNYGKAAESGGGSGGTPASSPKAGDTPPAKKQAATGGTDTDSGATEEEVIS